MAIVHQNQWQLLKKVVEGDRMPQAFIFSGQDGLGKKQVALEFIKLLQGRKVDYPDLILITPQDKEIHIGQIRDLQQNLSLRPYLADFKSVIIEQAHTLNTQAQNCFLKTLEEPPGKVLFVLLTAFPEMLLETIRSRCALLKFFPTGQPEVANREKVEALLKKDLAAKFAFAAKNQENLDIFLSDLIKYLRELLLKKLHGEEVNYSFRKLKQILQATEELKFLLLTTNINQRLALENLFLVSEFQ